MLIYATALREWRPLAEQGNADAQYNLGTPGTTVAVALIKAFIQ